MIKPQKNKSLLGPFWALITVAICLSLVLASTAIGAESLGIPIIVENSSNEAAEAAPVSAGIPFARRALTDVKTLTLSGSDGKAVPLQAQCLTKWPDGSCRWVLVDFQARVAAAVGIRPESKRSVKEGFPSRGLWAHTQPLVHQ